MSLDTLGYTHNTIAATTGRDAARLKLKGIDGDLHKQWIMRFNSMLNEEPYQG